MKVRITDKIQGDWINHCTIVSAEEGEPWNLLPGLEGVNSTPKLRLLEPAFHTEILKSGDFNSKFPKAGEIYSLFNGKSFSAWADMGIDRRLFAGDMGPTRIYGRGVGVILPEGMIQDRELKQALEYLEYKGEVIAHVDVQGKIVDFSLGSPLGCFLLYSYFLDKARCENCLKFILGEIPELQFEDKVSFNCLVSQANGEGLLVPSDFRQNYFDLGGSGIFTVSGNTIKEARARMKKAMHVLKEKNSEIIYRIDYYFSSGLSVGFETYGNLM